ncbi:helix-turn-helix domain-containing protein [Nonomuraea turcica]|uniref:helix-turn-helix domain-containing protein n=1 Tax=Nonomuraea sp. G32 TaxID=3067274 RepID=UPI00273B263A|nr:helix-turn-helix transcriptional regulator [Nonomuraea sp. G32]MDP4509666.1 helix-turn-helix transcriptional regulator [Nonomuraea sp. G32]
MAVPATHLDEVTPFGMRLRHWRHVRGISQLQLASLSGSTARHISFLETGRSRPGRDMTLRLAEVLDLPLRERNQLLQAAGWPPAYPQAAPDAAELRPFRSAIDRLLAAHEPFPALVLDGHARVVAANKAAGVLFGSDLIGANLLQRYLTDPTLRQAIVNWTDVAWAVLSRLRRQLRQAPLDERLRALVACAEDAVADLAPPAGDHEDGLVVCPWFRAGDAVIRTITLTARFDTAVEITLDDLRIELIYPQDRPAEEFFRAATPRDPDHADETGLIDDRSWQGAAGPIA